MSCRVVQKLFVKWYIDKGELGDTDQLSAFSALIVAEEAETLTAVAFQQDHASRRTSFPIVAWMRQVF